MTKRPTIVRYVDSQTGRTHTIAADVDTAATRKDIAASIERLNGMPPGRARVTSTRPA